MAYLGEYVASVAEIWLGMREAVHYRRFQKTMFGAASGQYLVGVLNQNLKSCLGMTSHEFRHVVGTPLLKAGCDLRMIQLILGHEDLKSTAVYTQVAKEELRDQLDAHHPRGSQQ